MKLKFKSIVRYIRSIFTSKRSFSRSETLFLVESLQALEIDLTIPNGSREKTLVKQSFVYYMTGSGRSSVELEALFVSIGLPRKGFSDRNIRHMIQTIGETPQDIETYRNHKMVFDDILKVK
jgi:hypothetical protein